MIKLSADTLLNAQMKIAIGGYLASAAITCMTTLLLYFYLQKYTITRPLYIQLWLVMQLTMCLIWIILYYHYHHNFESIKSIWEWWIEVPLNAFSGLGWGLTWALFINPENLHTVIFLNIITSAALFVYIVSTPLHPAATNTGLLFCILPIVFECYHIGDELFIAIGIGAVILGFSVYLFGAELHQVYLRNLLQLEENKLLLEALLIEKQQVEIMSQEKSRLLAISSHDLRQPIDAINLFSRFLKSSVHQPQQQAILEKIQQANQSLSNLLEPLLDVAKFDAGKIQMSPQWLYIDDLFYRLEKQYVDLAKEKGIQLRCVSTAQKLFIDPNHLERMVGNLVMNAIKHMGRAGKIVVGIRRQQCGLRLEIWDNGLGIPDAEQIHLFQPFYRSDTSSHHHKKGVGLGLSIVNQFADLMECRVDFRSIEGKGCYFSLSFTEKNASGDL